MMAARLSNPGYTPAIRELAALLDVIANEEDEKLATNAERAILRIDERHRARVVDAAVAKVRDAQRPGRGRLTRLLGRLGGQAAIQWLEGALADADLKTRRQAARALGKVAPTPEIERALVTAWDQASSDDDRRVLAEALGKVGGEAARARLHESGFARATLMLDRKEARAAPGAVDTTRAMPKDVTVRFHARAGLEEIVALEIGDAWRPRVVGGGVVEAKLRGPLSRATAVRTAIEVGFPLAPVALSEDLAATIVGAITAPAAMAILRAYSRTEPGAPIRFRVAFAHGGHRRAVAWRVAELVRGATSELVNDPRASTWEVLVDDDAKGRTVGIELLPRGFTDDRFVYRQEQVAASSHPTIAAAIALVAPRSTHDVVWDPFVGAGAELVERAYLGPYARLLGTDTDARAAAAARANLSRASVANATIEVTDACTYTPRGVTLILTNPPMGRRLHRGSHRELLERFVRHAAKILAPGGALVWTAPDVRVRALAVAAGLALDRSWTVDMGGFTAELCVHRKGSPVPRRRPARPARPRAPTSTKHQP
jgi:23S rRNA G2445 N2-methylase RlmL